MISVDEYAAIKKLTQMRPSWYVENVLGESLWKTDTVDQGEILDSVFHNRITCVKSCHGPGKLLPLDEPIPTPNGWKLNGDLKVGDAIYGPEGEIIRVIAAHDMQVQQVHVIRFTDGAELRCGPDHLWDVLTLNARNREKMRGRPGKHREYPTDWRDEWVHAETMSAEDMMRIVHKGEQRNLAVPLTRAIEGHDEALLIDPYILGVWLGDGTSSAAAVTTPDDEIRDACERSAGRSIRHFNNGAWRNVPILPHGQGAPILRELGVLRNKHIPLRYLRASVASRIALLRGLMDSDGNADPGSARVEFNTTSRALADDFHELVVSLGWSCRVSERRAMLYGADHGPAWRFGFVPDVCPFNLERQRKLWRDDGGQRLRHTARTIESIEALDEEVPMRCITVSHPRGLYLAGKSMVPTHNSFLASRAAMAFFDAFGPDCRVYTTAPTKRQVQKVLWSEIPRAYRKAQAALGWEEKPNIFDIQRAPEWHMLGFTATRNNENAFHGLHEKNMLIIVDEAAGIDEVIFKGILACATAENNHILFLGNPTDPTSKFASYCQNPRAKVFTISAWDTPNFKHFGITRDDFPTGAWRKKVNGAPMPYEYLTSVQWVADVWDDCRSFDDPYWVARVEGEFPSEHENQLIPLGWIEKARNRIIRPTPDSWRTFGLDIGETGPDEAPCIDNWGGKCRWKFIMKTGRANALWNRSKLAYEETTPRPSIINTDSTGGGYGVPARLQEFGIPTQALNMSTRSSDPAVFLNLRAELGWIMRNHFDPDQDDFFNLDIPETDEKLRQQLMGLRYIIKDGKRKLESKEEARKRGMKSPDRADALMLSTAPVRDVQIQGTTWV